MNGRWNLNLRRGGLRQPAHIELPGRSFLVSPRLLVLHYRIDVLCELVELILVDETFPFVNQDIGALCFDSTLRLQELLHCWIVLVAC